MESLIDQIKRHEGLRLKPYHCPSGKLTIGYGRNLEANGIYNDEADLMLRNDIERCIFELSSTFPWTNKLDIARREVLINMCFNLGINGLAKFKSTLKAIEEGNYENASSYMLDSLWAKQVGDRALELANQMMTGKYQEDK